MAQDHERVEPAPFDAAPAAERAVTAPGNTSGGRWAIAALAVLGLLALLVVFWLPERVSSPDALSATPPAATADQRGQEAPGARPPAPAAESPERTPYAEAQAARLRADAQDVLAELLDVRENLLDRGVERWGAKALAAVDELAATGDELYRERAYEDAIARYREALDGAVALEGRLPDELAAQLEAAAAAIEAGDIAAAEAAVDLAETLEPGLSRTAILRERVAALPEVVAQLEAAASAEEAGDLAGAREALIAATEADPDHVRAADELARVSDALTRERYTAAMSEGYAALDASRYEAAREAFRRAARLQPGSAEATAGLAEVEVAATAARLRSLREQAEAEAVAEDWASTVARYEAALALDPSVLFAQRGLARARARAALDADLEKALADPDRFTDPAVADDAAALLRRARSTATEASGATDRLRTQIASLDRVLERANTEVPVTLRSDGETAVTVYRVARLGSFEERTLDLRPGEYTAVGTRPGYRDVRREFRVAPEDPPGPITIACTERI